MSVFSKYLLIYLLKHLFFMYQHHLSVTKNVICLDLTNTTEKSLKSWVLIVGKYKI